MDNVAVFWDYESCHPPSNASGYDVVASIRESLQSFGSIDSLKAYLCVQDVYPKSLNLRSELQSSGVTLIVCPHNGQKDAEDKMLIVDCLFYALNDPTAVIVLITGDRDHSYMIAKLRLRGHKVIMITPQNSVHRSLVAHASHVLNWEDLVTVQPRIAPSPVQHTHHNTHLRHTHRSISSSCTRDMQDIFSSGKVSQAIHLPPSLPFSTPLRNANKDESRLPDWFRTQINKENPTEPLDRYEPLYNPSHNERYQFPNTTSTKSGGLATTSKVLRQQPSQIGNTPSRFDSPGTFESMGTGTALIRKESPSFASTSKTSETKLFTPGKNSITASCSALPAPGQPTPVSQSGAPPKMIQRTELSYLTPPPEAPPSKEVNEGTRMKKECQNESKPLVNASGAEKQHSRLPPDGSSKLLTGVIESVDIPNLLGPCSPRKRCRSLSPGFTYVNRFPSEYSDSSKVKVDPEVVQFPFLSNSTGMDNPTALGSVDHPLAGPEAVVPQNSTGSESGLPPAPLNEAKKHPIQDLLVTPLASHAVGRFNDLLEVLVSLAAKGEHQPLRSKVGILMGQRLPSCQESGWAGWDEHALQAENAGVVVLGGRGGDAWISLMKRDPSPVAAPAPSPFVPLAKILREYRSKGRFTPHRSLVCDRLMKEDRQLFKRNGFVNWNAYAKAACEAGIVTLIPQKDGQSPGISLNRDWWGGDTSKKNQNIRSCISPERNFTLTKGIYSY